MADFVDLVSAWTETISVRNTMASIVGSIARQHGLKTDQLRSSARDRQIAWPRQEAMYFLRQVKRPDGTPRYTYTQIGSYLGGRDHTTVIHGERAHEARLQGELDHALCS